MNNVSLLGRIATDLELKRTQNNNSYVRFSVDVDKFSNGNKNTDFIRCTAWGKTAENIVKYFSKGSLIAISGSIHTNTYTDRNGLKHNTAGVLISNFYFAGNKKEQNNGYIKQNSGYYGNYPGNNHNNYSTDKFEGYSDYDGYCR